MKNWFHRQWTKFKAWGLSILIALGLVVGAAYAEAKDFSWTNATQRVDGTTFPASELAETRIYCDGDAVPVITVIDGTTAVSFDFGLGSHTCFATHVDTNGQESLSSNTVTFDVLPARPNPPTLSIN